MIDGQNRAGLPRIKSSWPQCDTAGGNCIGYGLADQLGPNINRELMDFIWKGEDGSRLSLQKNRQGFTLQVTGKVHRSEGESEVTLEQFKRLKMHLDSTKNLNG